jgi:hypothetical protein
VSAAASFLAQIGPDNPERGRQRNENRPSRTKLTVISSTVCPGVRSGRWAIDRVGASPIGVFFNPQLSVYPHHEVASVLRGGDEDLAREEVRRFADRAKTNGRDHMSYLRSLAVLHEWDTGGAMVCLREAGAFAEEVAPTGELYERRGKVGEARDAYSRAARSLRALAAKIEDKVLMDFLSPRLGCAACSGAIGRGPKSAPPRERASPHNAGDRTEGISFSRKQDLTVLRTAEAASRCSPPQRSCNAPSVSLGER